MSLELNQKELWYILDALTETRNGMHARLDGEHNEDKRWELEENIQFYDYLIKLFTHEQSEADARSLQAAKQFDLEQVNKDLEKESEE